MVGVGQRPIDYRLRGFTCPAPPSSCPTSSPQPNEGHLSADTTDISLIEVPLVEREWKANHAVRDNTLVQKLCNTLETILGEAADVENQLPERESKRMPCKCFNSSSEALEQSRILLAKGVLQALDDCLWVYGWW